MSPSNDHPSNTQPAEGRLSDTPTVLVVDDDPHHAALVRGVLAGNLAGVLVSVAASVREMTAYLRGEWPYDDRTRYRMPTLIVASLTLPDLGGDTVLSLLEDEGLSHLPVIAFGSPDDISTAQAATPRANCRFLTKPLSFRELLSLARDSAAGAGGSELDSSESA